LRQIDQTAPALAPVLSLVREGIRVSARVVTGAKKRSALEGRSMTTEPAVAGAERAPALNGQTVVVLGGSAGIGLETARRARVEGADVVITARDPERLEHAAQEVGAISTSAFDALSPAELERFFADLNPPIDHVMVTAGGPYYAPLEELDFDRARQSLEKSLLLPLRLALLLRDRIRPGGSLLFVGGTGGRHTARGYTLVHAVTAATPALIENLALDIAPVRVNLIAPGFVDTGLSATILGDGLDARREQLRENLPIRRVVGPEDVAALAVHVMSNTALTGGTYDVDGGQRLAAAAWG
jgi:NAD(P)-dependent dehydrogenase (short-subunit alcohol dehydrogenase family)